MLNGGHQMSGSLASMPCVHDEFMELMDGTRNRLAKYELAKPGRK